MDRFWSKIDRRGWDECWPWLAGRFPSGYGQFKQDGKTVAAHRVVWLLMGRSLPDGKVLDHTCHNEAVQAGLCAGGRCVHRRCCNPRHLRLVSQRRNVLDGDGLAAREARQTTCLRGHDLTDPSNLKPNARGVRQCRSCVNEGRRRRYAERTA